MLIQVKKLSGLESKRLHNEMLRAPVTSDCVCPRVLFLGECSVEPPVDAVCFHFFWKLSLDHEVIWVVMVVVMMMTTQYHQHSSHMKCSALEHLYHLSCLVHFYYILSLIYVFINVLTYFLQFMQKVLGWF